MTTNIQAFSGDVEITSNVLLSSNVFIKGPGPVSNVVAIGIKAGYTTQGIDSVAIGTSAGDSNQDIRSVAVGPGAGQYTQGPNSLAIGDRAGNISQSYQSVAVGLFAGESNQVHLATAIGPYAGRQSQSEHGTAIGYAAGYSSQGADTVAVGREAAKFNQGGQATAVGLFAAFSNQGASCTAIGRAAGMCNQGFQSVAVGDTSGYNSQAVYSTAVGIAAGGELQGSGSVAIGYIAGNASQGVNSVAIGYEAGRYEQDGYSTAIGYHAGLYNQGPNSLAIGDRAGKTCQEYQAVAVGLFAAENSQGHLATAIGPYTARSNQSAIATAIGYGAGYSNQGASGLAVGREAGHWNQKAEGIAVGYAAGFSNQGSRGISIGLAAGYCNQKMDGIAIGTNAGFSSQGLGSVAIGQWSGRLSQGEDSVAIGRFASQIGQGNYAVGIGFFAGETSQSGFSTAVGTRAGQYNQGANSVAIGYLAGQVNQDYQATAVGYYAGYENQGVVGIALGNASGRYNQSDFAIALGDGAGETNQGVRAIAIGYEAGRYNQPNDSFYTRWDSVRSLSGSHYDMFIATTGEFQKNTSDDRLKHNEKFITGAVKSLCKLRPQEYLKRQNLDANVVPQGWTYEAGLMAQEVYYSAPELRHIVMIPPEAGDIDNYTPPPSDDPTQDPDYSMWGDDVSTVAYNQLIPYLVKAVQEIVTELPRSKTTVSNAWGQNIVGLVVSANENAHKTNTTPIVALSNVYMDKAWYGVVSDKTTDTNDYDTLVDTKGDTRIWVTDVGGPLESGDLVTTSNIAPGYAQKQADDLLRSSTVAKVTQDCDFTEPVQRAIKVPKRELSNVTYYRHDASWYTTLDRYEKIPDFKKTVEEEPVYFKEVTNGGRMRYYQGDIEVSREKYDTLPENDRTVKYIDEIKVENYNRLDAVEKATYSLGTRKKYKVIEYSHSKTQIPQHDEEIVVEELVDVLDENGQIVWEDTANTVPAYTLVDHGTYKAALVTCKLI